MCQKIVNVLAVSSFIVSGAVVVSGLYVYVNRGSIIDGVQRQIMDGVTGGMGNVGGLAGGTGGALVPEAGIPGGERSMGLSSPF